MRYTPLTMKDIFEASEKKLFNVISTFAGMGGSSMGYRLAGGNILMVNEFVRLAYETYKANFPKVHIDTRDIRQIKGTEFLEKIGLKVGELDILDGSPPCASFSMAGNREKDWGKIKSYSNTQQRVDDLFFEYARVIGEIQPKVFVAENVSGLTFGEAKELLGSMDEDLFGSSQEGTILGLLKSKGYKVSYDLLEAKDFGVPQRRERIIIVGVRNDIDKKISFPLKTSIIISFLLSLQAWLYFTQTAPLKLRSVLEGFIGSVITQKGLPGATV